MMRSETSKRQRGFACVALHNPKNSVNVGGVLRAAGVYGAAMVVCSGERIPFGYRRSATDTMKAYRHMPLLAVADLRAVVPFDCIAVGVDLIDDALPLPSYAHPERAFYVFGPEDGTLDDTVTSWCRDVVHIPTRRCMNLAACVNVVLYDRLAKKSI